MQGVIFGKGLINDSGSRAGQRNDSFGKFQDAEFIGIAKIDRSGKIIRSGHHTNKSFDQIIHKTKRAGLASIAKYRDVTVVQRLKDKIAHHPTIIGMHARTIGVKNSYHPDFYLMLPMIIKK